VTASGPHGTWRLAAAASATLAVCVAIGCGGEREMRDSHEMPDTMEVIRAMHDASERDALLDTMPGGEMVRGDSAAEMELLEKKVESSEAEPALERSP
jgi:hypothetical protein